jgi:hypothetical protein
MEEEEQKNAQASAQTPEPSKTKSPQSLVQETPASPAISQGAFSADDPEMQELQA